MEHIFLSLALVATTVPATMKRLMIVTAFVLVTTTVHAAVAYAQKEQEVYTVQCGVLSSEGLKEDANPRLSSTNCILSVTYVDGGSTEFDLVGTLYGQRISWTFRGDLRANVYKQVSPQEGGKFNRNITNGLACFVPFDTEGLDDWESLVCYKRSTLRKVSRTSR